MEVEIVWAFLKKVLDINVTRGTIEEALIKAEEYRDKINWHEKMGRDI